MSGAPIRAVLFDWGDTLFESPNAPAVIREAAEAGGIALDEHQARRMWDELWEAGKTEAEHAKGRDLSRDAHERVWTELFSRANARIPGIDRVLYTRVMDPSRWLPYPDTEPTLRALAARGVKIGIVSNHAYDLRPFVAAAGLDRYVDGFFLSYEVGAPKPDPRIFQEACRRLGVHPAEALMVGDDAVSDGGAAAAGLRVFLLPANAAPGAARGLGAVVDFVDGARR